MAVKSKRGRRTQKTGLRHKRGRNRSRAVSAVSRKRHSRSRRLRGGNYETDVTIRTLEGEPIKGANKVVTTVPGYGVMSAAAYLKLMEDKDRNGSDYYD
jgi:hypothetical protein